MSLVQLPPAGAAAVASTIYGRSQYAVEIRQSWADSTGWQRVNYLTPLSCVECCAPGIGFAKFLYRYGVNKWEDQNSFSQYVDLDMLDQYVRIKKIDPNGNTTVLWTGILQNESLRPFGGGVEAGDQLIDAYSLTHLLTREAIRKVKAQDPAGKYIFIEDIPTCNVRFKHGWNIYGNRSLITPSTDPATLPNSADSTDTAYVFYGGGPSANASQWSFLDIADMICQRHAPANGPTFMLAGQRSIMAQIFDTVRLAGRTPWEVLCEVVSRNRGVGFAPLMYFGTELGGSQDIVLLNVFSLLEDDLTAQGISIPANPNVVDFDADTSIDMETPVIIRSTQAKFNRIEVRGKAILQTFTVSYLDSTLEPGWSGAVIAPIQPFTPDPSTAEYRYLTLGGPATHTDPDDNDSYRCSDDRLAAVYVKHRLPMDWKGVVKNYGQTSQPIIPSINDNGELSFSTSPFYRLGKRFEHFLPFQEGTDYSVDPPNAYVLATSAEPSFMKPMAIVKDPDRTFFYMVDAGADDELQVASSTKAHFSVFPRELAIGVHAHPPHIYAANSSFSTPDTSAQNGLIAETNDEGIFNYTDILATVAIRCDSVVKVVVQGDASSNSIVRTKFIDVEDAELWLAAKGTVIGVNPDGTLARYAGSGILRDDRPRLQAIAAFASAWYGRERAGITFSLQRIDPFSALGTLIDTTVTAGVTRSIGTCVTSVGFDFGAKPRTTVQTGYSEIDFQLGYIPKSGPEPGEEGDDNDNRGEFARKSFKHGKSAFGDV